MSRYTLATSIANRFTGVALSAGLLLLVYWLVAVAGGARSYARALRVLTAPLTQLIYVALIVAFCYHLVAGVRHLVWDTGRGLERAQSRSSARLVIAVSLVLILLLVYRVWFAGMRAT
ncbi:MAG: succinate dehydrogenase, cytochrome b556 subunit [Gammaproteobacteria bacterium]|nr:succinate dehydrogenase, cytochrome b556 subunit [Gammaproteobacteria bacterium]MBV9318153.1 succinate dehydrogenase, cytochrome b556 subunit [Gammaproteobacteria bacterium]MBV9724556.1 succinate dehydrogenase, cytochrome b556 subunit [Gammaproteobacteria bacterium]